MPDPYIAKSGLANVNAGTTELCNFGVLKLHYRTHQIELLTEAANFDEVVYLLLHGYLPNWSELAAFQDLIFGAMTLPPRVVVIARDLTRDIPREKSRIDALRMILSMLSHYDDEADKNSREANLRKSARLFGKTIAAIGVLAEPFRASESKLPRPKLSLGANLLTAIVDGEPGVAEAKLLDLALILYAEHGFTPSSFVARAIASTQTDIYSAICGALGSLKGRLHGGAIEAAMKQWKEIEKTKVKPRSTKVRTWLEKLPKGELIMGFGHRIHKEQDPRERLLREASERFGPSEYRKIAEELTVLILSQSIEGIPRLHPNLDLPAAYTFHQLRIPMQMYSTVFACGRMAGWCAHVIEQLNEKKIIRPLSSYDGRPPETPLRIDDRPKLRPGSRDFQEI